MNLNDPLLRDEFNVLLSRAMAEDLGDAGDITGTVLFSAEHMRASVFSRQWGVLSGIDCAEQVFIAAALGAQPRITRTASDGEELEDGRQIMEIQGNAGDLLRAERIALNFLGFLSGVAACARRLSAALGDSPTRLLDTRKTVPAYRRLSKAAARDGGAVNHRMGLYDMIMIKDNHISAAGSITQAVKKIRAAVGARYAVEVECADLEDVREALSMPAGAVDRIMLDNMSYEQCRAALRLRKELGRDGQVSFEASGDFNAEKIRRFADLPLEYISAGAITHSAMNHNFSMRID